jgi:hypothetical protein
MIDMRCVHAPAGVSARGALVVRPAAGDAVLTARPRYALVRSVPPFHPTGTAVVAPTAPFQGTGLPVAGIGGTDALRTDNSNQRTTLGIHSPGRPQS